jgi:hypothetical protein
MHKHQWHRGIADSMAPTSTILLWELGAHISWPDRNIEIHSLHPLACSGNCSADTKGQGHSRTFPKGDHTHNVTAKPSWVSSVQQKSRWEVCEFTADKWVMSQSVFSQHSPLVSQQVIAVTSFQFSSIQWQERKSRAVALQWNNKGTKNWPQGQEVCVTAYFDFSFSGFCPDINCILQKQRTKIACQGVI